VPNRKLKALLFDVDGVLAETERDGHLPAFNDAFRKAGFEWDWDPELYRRLLRMRGAAERMRHFFRYWRPCGVPRTGNEPLIEALCRSERRHYLRRLSEGAVPLRGGVRRLVREASLAGLQLAAVTTDTRDAVETLLWAGLGTGGPDLFGAMGPGEAPGGKGPLPDLYTPVLAELGVAPGEVIAFSSSPERCALAASAGLRVVVTPSEYTPRRRFPGARLVVSVLGSPEIPFRVMSGDALGHRLVNVAAVRAWHRAWNSAAAPP